MPSKSLIPPPCLNPTLPRRNALDAPSSMCANDLDPRSAAPQFRGPHHRRVHSELAFRISEDLHLGPVTEDDFFRTFMDVEKIGSGVEDGAAPALEASGHLVPRDRMAVDCSSGNEETRAQGNAAGGDARPMHRHGSSVDVSSSRGDGVFGDVMEAKKAMPPEKLAELAVIDPRRAKRILANRQSAARSKQRKANYILELERKVQTLQTEATTLSAQLILLQKDISELATENAGLKLWLQSMEQQAQLHDGVSDALKQEVERLHIVTGGKVNKSEPYNLGLLNLPYSSLMMPSEEQPKIHPQGLECHAQFCQSQLYHNDVPSDMMQQGQLKVLPGLNIRKGSIKCCQSRELYRCK
ncbi:hypothetical protein C4D60_Mb05t31260 [Musa balbisiana]|uniref:BZIP domain-containing protein n=1 Tax=Musa balbisiana TaxID=52838 RepID=A0A4S8K052_MUSBA|nr:hypothetical protein C4D60_Mb05t31260 [Musa balbisiana]